MQRMILLHLLIIGCGCCLWITTTASSVQDDDTEVVLVGGRNRRGSKSSNSTTIHALIFAQQQQQDHDRDDGRDAIVARTTTKQTSRSLVSTTQSFLCPRLNTQILGSVNCQCKSLSLTLFEFSCVTTRRICDPFNVICGIPSMIGTIGWVSSGSGTPEKEKPNKKDKQDDDDRDERTLDLAFQGAACIEKVSVREQDLFEEPLCVQVPYEDNTTGGSFIGNLIRALLGLVRGVDAQSSTRADNNNNDNDCVAKLGDMQCTSCTKCKNDGATTTSQQQQQGVLSGSYTFNCSNIVPNVIVSTCQTIQLPKSFRGKRQSISLFVPQLDTVVDEPSN